MMPARDRSRVRPPRCTATMGTGVRCACSTSGRDGGTGEAAAPAARRLSYHVLGALRPWRAAAAAMRRLRLVPLAARPRLRRLSGRGARLDEDLWPRARPDLLYVRTGLLSRVPAPMGCDPRRARRGPVVRLEPEKHRAGTAPRRATGAGDAHRVRGRARTLRIAGVRGREPEPSEVEEGAYVGLMISS